LLNSTQEVEEVPGPYPSHRNVKYAHQVLLAAFDYKFGALENAENPLGKAYFNLMWVVLQRRILSLTPLLFDNPRADTFGSPTRGAIFAQSVAHYLPTWFLRVLADNLPSPNLERVRATERVATHVARSLIESKVAAFNEGRGSKDVMSLLGMPSPSRENAQ
jgi:hypothetical protein